MKKIIVLCYLLITIIVSGQELTSSDQQMVEEKQVWAFYLSFWTGEASWVANEGIITDYPLIGRYNSKMPDVAAQHIAQAKSAGINAFIVSWFGIQELVTTTPAFISLLDRAAEMDFQVAVGVDAYNPAFNREFDGMRQSLQWLMDEAISHPGYLHYQGKPIIVFAFQDETGWNDQTWLELRDTVDPWRETYWIAEGLSACCLYDGAMDGMYAFNMAWASGEEDYYIAERNLVNSRGGIYIPSISPGWDEATIAVLENRPRPTSSRERDNGSFLLKAWQAAINTESRIVMIVSWNEFMENSHIEPSEQYGTQSLDTLRPLIEEWLGKTVLPVADQVYSYVAQVKPQTPAFENPSTESALLAILEPGRNYPVIAEDYGWYQIRLDDSTLAFVHFSQIDLLPVWDD